MPTLPPITTLLTLSLLTHTVISTPFTLLSLHRRASTSSTTTCSTIHTIIARETDDPTSLGLSSTLISRLLTTFTDITAEALIYPACNGFTGTCAGLTYANATLQGVDALATAVNDYAASCPKAQIVLVGYAQGAQVVNDALCGGPDANATLTSTSTPFSAAAVKQIQAAILLGDPRRTVGDSFNVGTCAGSGFAARTTSTSETCASSTAKMQSYCDAEDPFCCDGADVTTHEGYAAEYGGKVVGFLQRRTQGLEFVHSDGNA